MDRPLSTQARDSSSRPDPTQAEIEGYTRNPLWQVPAEWRCAVWDFWSFWSAHLDNQIALSSRLRHWIADGLTIDDAREAFRMLMAPDVSRRMVYKGQLLAELADLVAAKIDRRRQRERQDERRRRDASDKAAALPLAEVARALGGIGLGG